MRHQLNALIFMATTTATTLFAQPLDFARLMYFEHQLDDVMEVMDTAELKTKLAAAEVQFQHDPSEINKARLGIIYHETALSLSFLSKEKYKGYARKSFDQLSELLAAPSTSKALMPFVASYRASALSLVSAETKKLKLLDEAFELFAECTAKYSDMSYLPEFLRGSVAENLPWFFFRKRKIAHRDFESIIAKQNRNADYANRKIMSFTYWAWANQHQGRKYRTQAIEYLNQAIRLDPDAKAGRPRAEQLKASLTKSASAK